MDPAERRFLGLVLDDLESIAEDSMDGVSERALRRTSVELRKLIVEGYLQRAWRLAGFQREPRLMTASLSPILDRLGSRVVFGVAGGAKDRGRIVQGMYGYKGTEAIPDDLEATPPIVEIGLHRFTREPCFVWGQVRINRHSLIKYVANKAGGAHFDAGRSSLAEEEAYRVLDNFTEMKESPAVGQPMKDMVYYELLAAGQAIAESSDAATLALRIRELLTPAPS
jgi:hypothetical protein